MFRTVVIKIPLYHCNFMSVPASNLIIRSATIFLAYFEYSIF